MRSEDGRRQPEQRERHRRVEDRNEAGQSIDGHPWRKCFACEDDFAVSKPIIL